jgi:hypothetical protein
METGNPLGWRFPLHRVAFGEAAPLLQAAVAPFRVAPLRLTGLFLLVWIPVLLLAGVQALGPFLSDVGEALAFTAYTGVLDAASRSELPDFRHLGVLVRFGRDKLSLLVLSGLVPIVVAVLVLFAVWGLQPTAEFLNALYRPGGHPSPVMELDMQAAEDLTGMPFTFVAPVWAVYRWSGSRSMAANLLACCVNWRWVVAITAFDALAGNLLVWLRGQSDDLALLSYLGAIALQMLTLSWTLAVVQRSFPRSGP